MLMIGSQVNRFAATSAKKPELLVAIEKAGLRFRPIHGSSEVLMDCPFDGCRKELHFYVNLIRRVGYCQRCKESANYRRLCKEFGIQTQNGHGVSSPAPTISELRQVHNAIFGCVKSSEKVRELPSCDFPMGTFSAARYAQALKYLDNRGISARDILNFELKFCVYGPYANRIIFPMYWDKKLVGFNARSVVKDVHPKYLFPKGCPSGRILYPQENLQIARCVITEGVIPAILYQGLATFGKKLTEEQLHHLIKSRYIRQIVLAWDRDAWTSPHPHREPPALATWVKLKKYYPCAGLILPEETPQPDQINRSIFMGIIESVWRKSTSRSAIWNVTKDGSVTKMG